jgi:hypothetical protein
LASAILEETAMLYREPIEHRWFFLLLNRSISAIIDNPDLIDVEICEPILEVVLHEALSGVRAAQTDDLVALIRSADAITEAYCALP